MRISVAMLWTCLAWPAVAQSPPLETGDPQAGHEVARTWCANCHLVERNQDRVVAGSVPSFFAIAERPTTTADGLRAFLATQHGRMPNLTLSNTNIENVVAYIQTLKGK